MSSPRPSDPPRIRDYELVRLVGRGAYGDVWLARGLLGTYCAIKIVWRDRFPDPAPYELEFDGLRAFAQLGTDGARQLALLHVGRNDDAGFFYYVMELADDVESGQAINPEHYTPLTVKRWFSAEQRLPLRELVKQAVNLAHGLARLHANGLVHRDIKPANLVVIRGRAKLADLGLVANSHVTTSYVGTEGFVAPEGMGTPAADVYSLGKVLYELATGRDRHDFPRLPDNLHDRPDRGELLELNEIIVRACDPEPARRHPDAGVLLEELTLLESGGSVRQLRQAARQVRQAYRLAAALAVAAVLAFAGAVHQHHRARAEHSARLAAEAERDEVVQTAHVQRPEPRRAASPARPAEAWQLAGSPIPTVAPLTSPATPVVLPGR